jgi:uncharacterized SAM-binding protein YcdF (DUF218 family)
MSDDLEDAGLEEKSPKRRRWPRILALLVVLFSAWLVLLGSQIVAAGGEESSRSADVAIVLGAAVHGDRPSPVFEERIRHGVTLYRQGRVRRLLLTGGAADGGEGTEAAAARRFALAMGVPAEAILIEERSRTTLQNLVEARQVMQANGLRSILLVSDPLHMKRALAMCAGLAMDCTGSPTPTSRYRGFLAKAGFLLRELLFYHAWLIAGH